MDGADPNAKSTHPFTSDVNVTSLVIPLVIAAARLVTFVYPWTAAFIGALVLTFDVYMLILEPSPAPAVFAKEDACK